MSGTVTTPTIIENAPIETWFGVGGRADRLVRPESVEEVAWCVRSGERLRVLGEGANLLVHDDGVDGLVVDLGEMKSVRLDAESGLVSAQAGVDLRHLINKTARAGLAGIEVLAGIPATVGGAVFMNAGGRFGSIADVVRSVEVVRPSGAVERLDRESIAFGYRSSGIVGIITEAEFALEVGDAAACLERRNACMAYKRDSQPLDGRSAGCCFKNPTLVHGVEGVGEAGQRVSAGMLIDRAGCKGLRHGLASVSTAHANFLLADRYGGRAADVIELMEIVVHRVQETFGVTLEREVVVWERGR